jgi:hypothetical protein
MTVGVSRGIEQAADKAPSRRGPRERGKPPHQARGPGRQQTSERMRPGCDQAMITWAATIGPMPGSSSSLGASARTWPRISASSSPASVVAASIRRARLRSRSRVASSSALAQRERRRRLQRSSSCPTGTPRRSSRSSLGSGDDHAAQLHERLAPDVDRTPPRDQQQPQRLAPLPRARQRERLARKQHPRYTDRVERNRPCPAAAARLAASG